MLNPFPELLSYALLAPLFLRVVLGMIFINLGYLKLKAEKANWVLLFETAKWRPASFWVGLFAIIEIIGGITLVAGIYTQIAALVFVAISLLEMKLEKTEPVLLKRNFVFYLLLFAISLSLLFSGAGAFSFDLPL